MQSALITLALWTTLGAVPSASLRHFENLPSLPSGYFGMFTIAYFPPLWRYVMDDRLLTVVGRNASRINLDPQKREALIAKYGLLQI